MKTRDDFNWDTYTTEYERQITTELEVEDKLYLIINNKSKFLDNNFMLLKRK